MVPTPQAPPLLSSTTSDSLSPVLTRQPSRNSSTSVPRESAIPIAPSTSLSSPRSLIPEINVAVPSTPTPIPVSPTSVPLPASPISEDGAVLPSVITTGPSPTWPLRERRPTPPGPIVIPPRDMPYAIPSPVPSASTSISDSIWPPRSSGLPRGPRPSEPATNFNPGWSAPFPSAQLGSPPRPKRPARPDEALMFASPLPFPGYERLLQSPASETTMIAGPTERVDLATFLQTEVPTTSAEQRPTSPTSPVTSFRSLTSSPSIRRKPVPVYEPTSPPRRRTIPARTVPPPVSPRRIVEGVREAPNTPNRLSIGGFEALLARGVPPVSEIVGNGRKRGLGNVEEEGTSRRGSRIDVSDESPRGKRRATFHGETASGGIYNPRLSTGLEDVAFDGRDQRRRRDSELIKRGSRNDDKMLSWSEKLRQSWIPAWTSSRRSVATSPIATRDIGPPQEQYSHDIPKSIAVISNDKWKEEEKAAAAQLHAHSHSRNPSTQEFRHLPLHNTPNVRRRSTVAQSRSNFDNTEKSLQEVVVLPSAWDEDSIYSCEIALREPSFRPNRLDMRAIEYRGWLVRIIHVFYPFFVIAHCVATLFLDYNVIYTLAQIAISPALPSPSVLARRALINVPTVGSSTPWWIALGVYAGCTAIWVFVVCFWVDFVRGFLRPWRGNNEVPIAHIYRGAASFNLTCMSAFSSFSFLWRVRLAPLQRRSAIAQSVPGSRRSDFLVETFAYHAQNWPTILLLLPRAGISLAILLLFNTTDYGSPNTGPTTRDSSYFNDNGTLSAFAIGFLLANLAWAAYRLALWSFAVIGLGVASIFSSSPSRAASNAYFSSSHDGLSHSSTLDFGHATTTATPSSNWKMRRERRIRAAILMCTPRSNRSSPAFVSLPYKAHSRGHSRTMTPASIQVVQHDPNSTVDPNITTERAERRKERRERREAEARRLVEQEAIARKLADEEQEERQRRDLARGEAVATLSGTRWAGVAPFIVPTPKMTHSPIMNRTLGNAARRDAPIPTSIGSPLEPATRAITSPLGLTSSIVRPQMTAALPTRTPLKLDLAVIGDEPDLLRPPLKSHFSLASDITGMVPKGSTPSTPLGGAVVDFFSPAQSAATQASPDQPTKATLAPPVHPVPTRSPVSAGPSLRRAASFPTPPLVATAPSPLLDMPSTPNPAEDWSATTIPESIHAREIQATQSLTNTIIERRRMSEKLLIEVQKLGEAEEAVRREERRIASLRRISEVSMTPERTGLGVSIRPSNVEDSPSPNTSSAPQLGDAGSSEPTPRVSTVEGISGSPASRALLPPFLFSYDPANPANANLIGTSEPQTPVDRQFGRHSAAGTASEAGLRDSWVTAESGVSPTSDRAPATPDPVATGSGGLRRHSLLGRATYTAPLASPSAMTFGGPKSRESRIPDTAGDVINEIPDPRSSD